MVTSHGTIQGYNAQALVDDKHQVIVHLKASGKGQDYAHVIPMIDGAKENVAAIGLGEDYYLCPNKKQLKLYVREQQIDQNKFRRYRTEEDACCNCKLRKKCLQKMTGKRKYISINLRKAPENLSRQMIEKVDSAEGRKIYDRRFAVIEPVFANIRYQKRLDRFTLRANVKLNIQWMLYCIVHNIEKILNYGLVYA